MSSHKALKSKIIRIVEERGYMGTEYIPVIKKIISLVRDYIYEHPKNEDDGWKIYIPDELTKQIDFVDTLTLVVHVKDSDNGFNHSGGGTNSIYKHNYILNVKLAIGKIEIFGYSVGKYLCTRTIFNALSHELNHLLEYYNKLRKQHTPPTLFQKAVTQNEIYDRRFSDNETINGYIKNLFYRLLFKNEFNALINGVYGDLDSMNSKRKNFKRDLEKTQAYAIYDTLMIDIDLLDYLSDEEWQNIRQCYNINSVEGARHSVDLNAFKIKFKRHIEDKLQSLLKGIGKIASFYYDSQEDIVQQTELIMTDPNVVIK